MPGETHSPPPEKLEPGSLVQAECEECIPRPEPLLAWRVLELGQGSTVSPLSIQKLNVF